MPGSNLFGDGTFLSRTLTAAVFVLTIGLSTLFSVHTIRDEVRQNREVGREQLRRLDDIARRLPPATQP